MVAKGGICRHSPNQIIFMCCWIWHMLPIFPPTEQIAYRNEQKEKKICMFVNYF